MSGTPWFASLPNMFGYLRGHRVLFALTAITGVLRQSFLIASAALGAYLIGSVASGTAFTSLHLPLVLLAACTIGAGAFMWLEMWVAHIYAYRILAEVRSDLYDGLERLAPAELLGQRTGALASTVMSDVETLEWFYAHTVAAYLVAIVVPLGALGAFALIDLPLAAILFPFMVLIAVFPFINASRSAPRAHMLRGRLGELNAEVVDGIAGLRELLSFGRAHAYREQLLESTRSLQAAQMAYATNLGSERALGAAMATFGMLGVLAASAAAVAGGSMAEAMFPVTVILALYAVKPIADVSSTAALLSQVATSADRVLAVTHAPARVVDRAGAASDLRIVANPPGVRFVGVTFGYDATRPAAVSDLSFWLAPGQKTALVGHSGAGKSTCVSLLLRFWEVDAGRIEIADTDIRTLTQDALHGLISYVPQDVFLFNTTVAENLRLGRPDATDQAIEVAARDALAHDFIMTLPQRYDTIIGERGVRLSGGQRQRLAIARAFLKDAPILIMDEAASSLDVENEEAIGLAMQRVSLERTTLIVAHRLSTIQSADRVIVLDGGRVVQGGTFEQLISADGALTRLLGSQFGVT